MRVLSVQLPRASLQDAIEIRKRLLRGETWAIRFVNCRELSGPHALQEILLILENLPVLPNDSPTHTITLSGGHLSLGNLQLDLEEGEARAVCAQIGKRLASSQFVLDFELIKATVERHAAHSPFCSIGLRSTPTGLELVLRWQRSSLQPKLLVAEALKAVCAF